MAINKIQRLRLTFPRSCIYWSPINILKQSFSETIWPIELNFHMKTPYDNLAKFYTKCSGHMTKMADMPIYGKKTFKILLKNQKAHDLGTWYVELVMFVQIMILG